MTDKKHFQFRTRTRAGEVRGTLALYVEGEVDGLASVMEKLLPALLKLPVDAVEMLPGRTEKIPVRTVERNSFAFIPDSWELESLRMADETNPGEADGDEDEVGE